MYKYIWPGKGRCEIKVAIKFKKKITARSCGELAYLQWRAGAADGGRVVVRILHGHQKCERTAQSMVSINELFQEMTCKLKNTRALNIEYNLV